MLKLLGGALIVAAAGWTGGAPVVSLRRRIRILEELDSLLTLMRAELTSCLTPLPEMFQKLEQASSGVCAALFRDIRAGMLATPSATPLHLMRIHLPALRLDARENAILLELANALGCYDLDSQQRMLDAAQLRLRQAADRCRKQMETEGRGWCALGVCTGLALAIVLV